MKRLLLVVRISVMDAAILMLAVTGVWSLIACLKQGGGDMDDGAVSDRIDPSGRD